jgi:hypothetical protein
MLVNCKLINVMNDELEDLKDKNNKKINVNEIKSKSNNNSYSLNQYNKWINRINIEESTNLMANNKSKYNLTCYGNWLGIKNYDEKSSYYIKDSNAHNNIGIDYGDYGDYGLAKLKIYSIIVLNIFNKYFQFYNRIMRNTGL